MARKKTEDVEVYIPSTGEPSQKCEGSCFCGDTVFVALCHPTGIQFLFDNGKRRVKLNGNAANLIGEPKGVLPQGGFGLTEIARSDWEEILKTYGNMEIFKNGLCFAHEKKADVRAEADEKAELRHGREPIRIEDVKTEPVNSSEE